MFGKKKKRLCLALYGADGALLQRVRPEAFRLPEPVVLELSVQYFDDPEPCEIHRAAVHSRALMQLTERKGQGKVALAALEPEEQRLFGEYPCASFAVEEEA